MELMISLSTKPAIENQTKVGKEQLAKFKPRLEKLYTSIRSGLEKIGTVKGKPTYTVQDRMRRVDSSCLYTITASKIPVRIKVEFRFGYDAKSFKDARVYVLADCLKKSISKKTLSNSMERQGIPFTATGIVKASKAFIEKAIASKGSEAPSLVQEREAKQKFAAELKAKKQAAAAINKIAGSSVVEVKSYVFHFSKNSGVFASGTSDKAHNLRFSITEDGKFSISVCPKGFMGNRFETWTDKKFGTKPLTSANIKAALKKHGYL